MSTENQDSSEDSNDEETTEKRGRNMDMAKKKRKRDQDWKKFEMSLWHETRPQS